MTPLRLALLSIAVGVFPLLVMLLASFIANACGCTLNEAGAGKCVVFGKDVGGVLSVMFMFGWLGMITAPAGIIGVLSSAIWAVTK